MTLQEAAKAVLDECWIIPKCPSCGRKAIPAGGEEWMCAEGHGIFPSYAEQNLRDALTTGGPTR